CPGNTAASQCRRYQIGCGAERFAGIGVTAGRTTTRYSFDPFARGEAGSEESSNSAVSCSCCAIPKLVLLNQGYRRSCCALPKLGYKRSCCAEPKLGYWIFCF